MATTMTKPTPETDHSVGGSRPEQRKYPDWLVSILLLVLLLLLFLGLMIAMASITPGSSAENTLNDWEYMP